MYVFEKKVAVDKKLPVKEQVTNIILGGDKVEEPNTRQTERQRILELRQKTSNNVETVTTSYTNDGKEKKICKKCGEVNSPMANICKACKFKFPLSFVFDSNVSNNYSIHFWDKINKNNTIQMLKNFGSYVKIKNL